MKTLAAISILLSFAALHAQEAPVLDKVDRNLSSANRVLESQMIVHGKRSSRTVSARTYAEGRGKSFTEYLAPASEKGTKMLKLNNLLWIYAPMADRTIQISGNMLRQSVMGSDLSYEDMMDDRSLHELYTELIAGEAMYGGRKVIILDLQERTEGTAYSRQRLWVDAERFVPLRQELYAKSGQLLKKVEYSDIRQVDGRWYPYRMLYKDMLKQGAGTEFIITKIAFDQKIEEYLFTKAALKR